MFKCVIIDDERNSSELLELQLSRYCSETLKVVGVSNSPEEGIELVQKLKPNLLFLDIQMPAMNGFEFLERINPIEFDVIFITAHDEYAVKAFKYNALEYLLKPTDINELKSAVGRFEAKQYARSSSDYSASIQKRIALTTPDSLLFVNPKEVVYCESSSNYTFFHLNNGKKILVAKTLKEVEQILYIYNFFRIHNSYLINMDEVREFVRGTGGHVVMSNGNHLTVSRSRKEEFFNLFNKF